MFQDQEVVHTKQTPKKLTGFSLNLLKCKSYTASPVHSSFESPRSKTQRPQLSFEIQKLENEIKTKNQAKQKDLVSILQGISKLQKRFLYILENHQKDKELWNTRLSFLGKRAPQHKLTKLFNMIKELP